MYIIEKVKMGVTMLAMPVGKTAKPRVIVEVTEDEQLDLKALSFIRDIPAAQIIRGLLKTEIAKNRAEIDKAKKLIARR